MANTTKKIYDTLYAAYDHFNAELFDNQLQPAVLILHRKRNARGYFWNKQWAERDVASERKPEIALNPDHMGRGAREVMSTLAHEMAHQWDAVYGTVPASGHGKTWAAKMDEIGLTPTSTGKPGGKRTGRKVTHMIVDGGPFDRAYEALPCDLRMFTATQGPTAEKKRDLSKVKHSCPDCGLNVWGKLGIQVVCADCDQQLEPQL